MERSEPPDPIFSHLPFQLPFFSLPVAGHAYWQNNLDLFPSLGYLSHMNWKDRITIDPEKRSGKPCIRDLRITVYDVLEYLASGMSEEEILKDFPDLTREDIRACLAFAADRERKLVSIPPA